MPSGPSEISLRIGVDVGGTKIEAAALNPDGLIRDRRRIPTPTGSYPGTVQAIVNLVREIERELGEEGTVGVGIPGVVSADSGLVKNANSTWLNHHPLDRDLSAALGRPVKVANDANCFALSEAVDGAGADAEVVLGVILGTGVGAGVVVRRRPLTGANDIAGEWGHNPLPSPDPDELPGADCYCGRKGCIETFLSGPALSRQFKAAGGKSLPALEVAQLAEQGDPLAGDLLERYAHRLARGLAGVINILDPQVIVLGGGLSNISLLYRQVPRLWARYVFSDQVHTKLVPAVHGDAGGVRGAAWLWLED